MLMDHNVNVTWIPVTSAAECNNDDTNKQLEFFSHNGVVRLEILSIFFTKLSYSVVSSATGTRSYYGRPA